MVMASEEYLKLKELAAGSRAELDFYLDTLRWISPKCYPPKYQEREYLQQDLLNFGLIEKERYISQVESNGIWGGPSPCEEEWSERIVLNCLGEKSLKERKEKIN